MKTIFDIGSNSNPFYTTKLSIAITLLFTASIIANPCCSQESNALSDDVQITHNIIYIGGGRQGLTYIKYERLMSPDQWTQTILNIGFGGIPGDAENDISRTNKIMPEIGQLFGYKKLFLEVGIEPSISFFGKTTYLDLNGIIGLRFQPRIKQPQNLFLQAGYNPKLYYTYSSEIEVPFYFGIGLSF